MPQVRLTVRALADIKKCQEFLVARDADAALKATQAIYARIGQLEANPLIGRPHRTEANLREIVIQFGMTGYIALYRYKPATDQILILAVRHQREAGY